MKEFPITTKKGKEYIPYDIIKPHEEQAFLTRRKYRTFKDAYLLYLESMR